MRHPPSSSSRLDRDSDVGFGSESLAHDSLGDNPLHFESSHLELPNIPGLRPSNISTLRRSASAHKHLVELQAQSRPHTSKMLDGYTSQSQLSYFEDPGHFEALSKSVSQFPSNAASYADLRGRYSLRSQQADRARGKDPHAASEAAANTARGAMRFFAFSIEKLPGNLMEPERLHLVEIIMHPDDGTLEIKEPRTPSSSGIMPLALKRHRVIKPGHDTTDAKAPAYTVHDAFSSALLTIYGINYVLYDADRHTREYLNSIGLEFGRAFSPPTIKYKPGASINSLANPSMSLSALKPPVSPDLREGSSVLQNKFVQMGSKVLRFFGFWMDADGGMRNVKLHYFLVDDTIEIVNVHERNDGRDHPPTFLKRLRIRKPVRDASHSFSNSSLMGPENNAPDSKYYMHTDLNIGSVVEVAGVAIHLVDCDGFTREFYESELHISLAPPMHVEEAPVLEYKVIIPPHNGIGSEEDSLQTCTGSLMPKPVRKNLALMAKYAGICLRYKAKFANPRVSDSQCNCTHVILLVMYVCYLIFAQNSDRNRDFTIQAYPEDNTILIQETAVRNSGFAGGRFLARLRHKNRDGSPFELSSLFIGTSVEIRQHMFVIEDADERTLSFMESHSDMWPQCDARAVRAKVGAARNSIQPLVSQREESPLTYAEARELLQEAGIDISLQESITLFRQLDPSHSGSIQAGALIM